MADAALLDDDPEARAARRRYLVSRVVIYGLLGLFALVYLRAALRGRLQLLPRPARDRRSTASSPSRAASRFRAWAEAWTTFCINGTCEGMQRNFFNSLWMTDPGDDHLDAARRA